MAYKRILSFKYALEGLGSAFKKEPNLKIHFLAALVVIVAGVYLNISTIDWIAVMICIGAVISVELTNTALEEVVDSFTDSAHPGAKLAKDVSAAAVLIVCLMALFIGILIFWPLIFK
jgi:undecaprenol kinase